MTQQAPRSSPGLRVPSDPPQAPQSIRFGQELELDRSAYQLRRSGVALKLERIPLEILLLLTELPGQLVTREHNAERIWGKNAYLNVDNSINGAIRKIRQVLKDDPEQPRFVETITGRGYRFVAPVVDPAAVPAAFRGTPAPAMVPPRPRPRSRVWHLVALTLLLLAGAF